jgi:hypothetical protein
MKVPITSSIETVVDVPYVSQEIEIPLVDAGDVSYFYEDGQLEIDLLSPTIGHVVSLEEGMEFFIASDRRDVSGTVGNSLRESGAYTVDGFSFIGTEGQIIQAVFEPGADALEIKAEIEATGIEVSRIEMHVNKGASLSRDMQTGWIPLNENMLHNWSDNVIYNLAPQLEANVNVR